MKSSQTKRLFKSVAFTATALAFSCAIFSCKKDDDSNTSAVSMLANHSITPALVQPAQGFSNLKFYSLISSEDKLTQTPSFVFGGSADGTGLLRNPNGDGFTMLVNHEDNFAVSRIGLDNNFKPIKGEYLLNSDGGQWRLCSATLATQEVHGFGPLYLTCGESGEESRTHAINPFDAANNAGKSREVPAFGRWSAENAVPLPKTAFPNKTVILIGDDDSGTYGGQLVVYVADGVGNLDNGKVYVLRTVSKNKREMDIKAGQTLDVEFVEIADAKNLTGKQMNEKSNDLSAIQFGRVEDIDYRKGGSGREVYFNVTGQANSGANANYDRSKYGRTYKIVLDEKNPTLGKLELMLDGDDRAGKAKTFQNVDNICVTENYAYIQEDPNGYGDEMHDSYIYQFNLNTKELKVVTELHHRRVNEDTEKYNGVANISKKGSWEYGSLVDISDIINVPNTFMLCIQPHTWVSDAFKGVDGGSKRLDEKQASQIVLIQGLAK